MESKNRRRVVTLGVFTQIVNISKIPYYLKYLCLYSISPTHIDILSTCEKRRKYFEDTLLPKVPV